MNEAMAENGSEIVNCVKQPDKVLFGFIIAIVIVGLFGNAVVFIGILALKEFKKSISNWYMLHLAMAHILFLLMLPFTAYEDKIDAWTYSESLCKAKEGIIMVNYYASIFFLELLSFDLYIAVTKSKLADTMRRLEIAAGFSAVAWLVSICLPIPLYIYSHVDICGHCLYNFPTSNAEKCAQVHLPEKECKELFSQRSSNATIEKDELEFLMREYYGNKLSTAIVPSEASEETCWNSSVPKSYRTWLLTNFCIMLVLPLVLLCVFYGMIIRTMLKSTASENDIEKRNRRRMTVMMVAFIILFVVSWVPWFVVQLIRTTGVIYLSKDGCRKLENFTRIMVYLYSALMPYIYAFMAPRFYRRFVRSWSFHSPESHVSTPTSYNGAANHNGDLELKEVKLDSGDDKE